MKVNDSWREAFHLAMGGSCQGQEPAYRPATGGKFRDLRRFNRGNMMVIALWHEKTDGVHAERSSLMLGNLLEIGGNTAGNRLSDVENAHVTEQSLEG